MNASAVADPTGSGGGGRLSFTRSSQDTLQIAFSGGWRITESLPSLSDVQRELESGSPVRSISFDTTGLTAWDSAYLTFLLQIIEESTQKQIQVSRDGLPEGVRRLLDLATAVPERKGAAKQEKRTPFMERLGTASVNLWNSNLEVFEFLGETTVAFLKLLVGRARFRPRDLWVSIQECGLEALPIVSLISALVGLIFAFVGAIQLKMFGAQIYVASLVGIAMTRIMGAVMTGIIMAGRTGASFAAQIGTMQANEEIDALKTLGISPMEFLVLPRMLSLMLMMPLLGLYSDFMGILGGMLIGVTVLDLNPMDYYNKTVEAVTLTHIWVGLFHSAVFGVIVSLAGCLRGMQCERSAAAVGNATTSAVVTSIVSIVVATSIITVVCQILDI